MTNQQRDSEDEGVAAAIVVLSSRRAQRAERIEPRSLWRDRAFVLRAPLLAGCGAWRASALPR